MNRFDQVREAIHQKWLQRSKLDAGSKDRDALRYQIGGLTEEVLKETSVVLTELERRTLIDSVQYEVQGSGPLEPLLQDPEVSDILVNGPDQVFIEKQGRLIQTAIRFTGNEHLRTTLDRLLYASGRRIDESSPMVDARLPSGARLHAVVPPIAADGITVSIRKFKEQRLSLKNLIAYGSLTEPMANLLETLMLSSTNILISGGTGSGKTTFLNALASTIPHTERVITLEEAIELSLGLPHVIRLEARPANIEGQGEITLRHLLKNALRMRPDRIIVGEVRGAEVFEMLQAMNSGHGGSMATLHANSPRDSIIRLENLMAMSGVFPSGEAIKRQITSAIQIIVHLKRFVDGQRRVVAISEVVGMESGVILLQDLFTYGDERGFYRTGVPLQASLGERS